MQCDWRKTQSEAALNSKSRLSSRGGGFLAHSCSSLRHSGYSIQGANVTVRFLQGFQGRLFSSSQGAPLKICWGALSSWHRHIYPLAMYRFNGRLRILEKTSD